MSQFKVNPFIEWREEGGEVAADLWLHGIVIRGHRYLKQIVEDLRSDCSTAALNELDPGVVNFLQDNFVLLPESEFDWLRYGLVAPCPNPIGAPISLGRLNNIGKNDMIVVHCPIELSRDYSVVVRRGGAQVRSYLHNLLTPSANASELLIDFDLSQSLRISDARIFDLGDVVFIPELERPAAVGARCTRILIESFKRSAVPVVLGGDHSLTYFALEALNRTVPEFGVIHFDAHHDFYVAHGRQGPACDALTHANVFHFVRRLSGVRQITQIGLRGLYRPAPDAKPIEEGVLPICISAREAERQRPAELLPALCPNIPYYVTFDVDVLDLARHPETATSVQGGLSYYCAFDLLRHVFTRARIVGIDFVEIGETEARESRTAEFAARAILLLLFALRGTSNLPNYVFSSKGAT